MNIFSNIIFFAGSIAPAAIILAAWLAAFRIRRWGWLVVAGAVVLSLPVGLLILSLVIPPADPAAAGTDAADFGEGLALLPAILLWALAAGASMLIPPLAWLARKISV